MKALFLVTEGQKATLATKYLDMKAKSKDYK